MSETHATIPQELLLHAQIIGLLELNIQAINSILERYQEELAKEKAIVQAYYRQGPPGLPLLSEHTIPKV
ncbi:hypothetical protein KYK14_09955 [Hymenobacter profundi]|uniref:Uncharacterized protein n=1 Tax=Hymenobacter profundi TaxID=1982110 RepID=A0ABS6WZD6_9BACT|nr:hypothetical protein [Hymenobacter profundi]